MMLYRLPTGRQALFSNGKVHVLRGFWHVIRHYPGIISEGFRLATDAPRIPRLCFDPNGGQKREERARQRREAEECMRRAGLRDIESEMVGPPPPPLKMIDIQWYDPEYDAWHDVSIDIDLDRTRIYHCPDWMLGRQHEGSGAIGVMLFAGPILLASSPYLIGKNKVWAARERLSGMSRHGIALMKALKGKLDPSDETLLREALENEWLWEQKMRREVSFDEACEILGSCDLIEKGWNEDGDSPKLHGFDWFDDDGDRVGNGYIEGDTAAVRVLGSEFTAEQAKELMTRFKSRENE